ncbi:MAG: NAD-dependent epimerase/dehydratase family protein, partial [Alphaproteobacteria bacterium]|nr:NAD-dependent epimerase/dehydratase family protein [Alphaproteobacteria bacterium]
MQVVIIGAAGMLGKKLVKSLLARGTLARADGAQQRIERLALFDTVPYTDLPADPRVTFTEGQVYDAAAIHKLITPGTTSVFHFAAVVSAGAEADLELGYKVNLDGTRVVLDACRALGTCPRVVFTSSVAVYGGDMPETIPDNFALTPQTSYGTQKAMGELL